MEWSPLVEVLRPARPFDHGFGSATIRRRTNSIASSTRRGLARVLAALPAIVCSVIAVSLVLFVVWILTGDSGNSGMSSFSPVLPSAGSLIEPGR